MQWISPRNHMVFTPLLASTAVGTLEFRSVALPVREVQSALAWPQNNFICANASAIDPRRKAVECTSLDGLSFDVKYDQLVIATGAAGSTFGIPGVERHTHFLRDVSHASAIRSKLIENLSLANTPGAPPTCAAQRTCAAGLLGCCREVLRQLTRAVSYAAPHRGP
jgi:NADH:ubiquinone reductase (non-electrogenic)